MDGPSLEQVGLITEATSFVTVMVAIDEMTAANGCLEVVRGLWTSGPSGNAVPTKQPGGDNPDGDGRLGAVDTQVASKLAWEVLECSPGDVYFFSGLLPHRSGSNHTSLPRRAAFLTYNHPDEGDVRERYYGRMGEMRERYKEVKEQADKERERRGREGGGGGEEEEWLSSVPK